MEKRTVGFIPSANPVAVVKGAEVLKKFNLTWDEVMEYARLKAIIFGKGGPFKQLFVELDLKNNEDHIRYNELSGKMVHLHAHLLANRNAEPRTLANRLTSKHHDE